MYKHVALLVRREDLSHDEFKEHWQIASPTGVVRAHYVFPVEPEQSEFDGLAELYFESDALSDALDSETLTSEMDEFLDTTRCQHFTGEDIVEKDAVDANTDGLYKHSAFLVRKDGLTHEEFMEHWANEHVPLAREIPGVVRYVRCVPSDPVTATFDGIAELYFEDIDALRAGLGHESSRDYDPDHPKAKAPREDVDNFLSIEDRPRFVGQERVITDGTDT